MKARIATAAALAATGAYAQGGGNYGTSYTTVTVDDCETMSMESMITVTNGITVTYCPQCDHQTEPTHPGYTTTYTTTYMSLCPTGMVPKTYTVTESCDDEKPTWTPGPSHIPQGYTVTEKDCHVCGESTSKVTVTEPCGCEAHEGEPGPPPPRPNHPAPNPATPTGGSGEECYGDDCGGSGSGGWTPDDECDGDDCGGSGSGGWTPDDECDGDDCGGSGSGSGSTPPGSGEPCEGDDCGGSGSGTPPVGHMPGSSCEGEDCGGSGSGGSMPGSGPSPPYPTPTGEECTGSHCRAQSTGSMPSGVDYGNTTGIMPAEGGASSFSSLALYSSSILAVLVASFAFML